MREKESCRAFCINAEVFFEQQRLETFLEAYEGICRTKKAGKLPPDIKEAYIS